MPEHEQAVDVKDSPKERTKKGMGEVVRRRQRPLSANGSLTNLCPGNVQMFTPRPGSAKTVLNGTPHPYPRGSEVKSDVIHQLLQEDPLSWSRSRSLRKCPKRPGSSCLNGAAINCKTFSESQCCGHPPEKPGRTDKSGRGSDEDSWIGPAMWNMPITKEELKRALPRHSVFSCHDKALRDAGFDVECKAWRQRKRLDPSSYHTNGVTDKTGISSSVKMAETSKIVTDDSGQASVEDKVNSLPAVSSSTDGDTAVGDQRKGLKSEMSHCMREWRPLIQYLTYVHNNPEEYRQMCARTAAAKTVPASALYSTQVTTDSSDDLSSASLVRMGRAFEWRSRGEDQVADDVVRAAYALRPRSAYPVRFNKTTKDWPIPPTPMTPRKESSINLSAAAVARQKPKSGNKTRPRPEAAEDADDVMEVDRRRLQAVEWTQTVTTEQLTRAKIQVLKDLGHEERELSQWWMAFRNCHYLRL